MEKKLTSEIIALVANRFRVLAEPTRLEILHGLDTDECSVGEIVSRIGATQPNVSKHLRVMQEAGILKKRQDKNLVYYSVADDSIFSMCDTVCNSLRVQTESQSKLWHLPEE